MNNDSKDQIKARVKQWSAAAPLLKSIRDENIKTANTIQSMKCFSGMVLSALPTHPPRLWSGLVEQQEWFRKLRINSTLLKILSRVTTQSEGRIKVRGRIASLREVGTGFHPELTGRENHKPISIRKFTT